MSSVVIDLITPPGSPMHDEHDENIPHARLDAGQKRANASSQSDGPAPQRRRQTERVEIVISDDDDEDVPSFAAGRTAASDDVEMAEMPQPAAPQENNLEDEDDDAVTETSGSAHQRTLRDAPAEDADADEDVAFVGRTGDNALSDFPHSRARHPANPLPPAARAYAPCRGCCV